MRAFNQFILSVVPGTMLGIALAYAAIEARIGFNLIHSGPWTGSPRAGGIHADPYTKARLARDGELPLGGGEGITFFADHDQNGKILRGSCTYRITGEPFAAGWWTLTLHDNTGAMIESPNGRYGFTSKEILRDDKGMIDIALSPRARSGNWLPTPADSRLLLVLRLYDTPFAQGAATARLELPRIETGACE